MLCAGARVSAGTATLGARARAALYHSPHAARQWPRGVRANEDLVMFRRLWPSPLAELIALAYKAGYR